MRVGEGMLYYCSDIKRVHVYLYQKILKIEYLFEKVTINEYCTQN